MRQVSDVAKIFGVDRDTIKRWCLEFADYLSPVATPPKGQTRFFDDSDIRVLAVIFYYWEEEPDFENIRYCLNSDHQNDDVFIDFAYLHSPVFRDPPDEVGEKYEYCIMLNGEYLRSLTDVARAYKTAGDALVEQAISNYYPYELAYPIFFNYRHAIELYLKVVTDFDVENEREHDLHRLIQKLEIKYDAKLPEWMEERLNEFHQIDPGSFAFRYSDSMPSDTRDQLLWIDLYQLRRVMQILCDGFE